MHSQRQRGTYNELFWRPLLPELDEWEGIYVGHVAANSCGLDKVSLLHRLRASLYTCFGIDAELVHHCTLFAQVSTSMVSNAIVVS